MTRPSAASICIARVTMATLVSHSAASSAGARKLLLVAVRAGLDLRPQMPRNGHRARAASRPLKAWCLLPGER